MSKREDKSYHKGSGDSRDKINSVAKEKLIK